MVYNMRTLETGDIFPLVSIISKIGLKDIAKCLGKDRLTKIVENVNKEKENDSTDKELTDDVLDDIGMDVALEILDVVLKNIIKCKDDIIELIASVCEVKVDKIVHQPLDDFTNQLFAFIRKKELMSFISVASKFIK